MYKLVIFLIVFNLSAIICESQNCIIQIISIECISQEDWTGTDQIYLKVDGNLISEISRISSGESLDCKDLEIIPVDKKSITLELWEYDLDADDLLLKKIIDCSSEGLMETSLEDVYWTAKYKIYYQVY